MNGLDLLIRSYETMREKGTEGGLRDTLSLALRHTGAVCLRLELTEEKKEYEISDVEVTSNGVATYVSGILQNNGGKKGYVQIMVPCYDKDGAKIGDALANVNNIAENGKWKFKAIFMGSEKPSKCNIEEMEVTGF